MDKIKFLETWNDKAQRIEKSNSRLIADVIICFAIVLVLIITLTACKVAWVKDDLDGLLGAGAAVGTTFVTVGGSAMYFLFNQKKSDKV